LCNGTSTVLTASTTAGTFTWSANAGSVSTNTVSVTPGVGTTIYTVSGDNSGCPGSNTVSVTVSTQPTVSISGATTHCSGSAMTLTASTTAGTYTWSTGPSTSTISVNPGVGTTTYTLNGTNGACTASTVATVTVIQTPTMTVNSPTICNGSAVILTATSTNTGSYSWNTGPTTNTISVSPGVGTTTYTVTGDNGNGCTVTQTSTVTVSAQPTVTISGATSNCSGSAMTLTASTTAGTYTWSTGPSTSTISVNPGLGNTTYTLNGSVGTCTASTTITVSVTATPTLNVNSATICSGQTTVLTANTANTYTWSTTETTNTISVSPTSTTVYTVTGDDGNGCTAVKTATVTVNPTPTLSITGAHVICSGQSITLTGGTATNYTWLPGGQNTATLSITPPSGSNSYTLNGANGTCTATATVLVDVSPSPTLSVNSANICSGQTATLTASGAATYSWSANAGGIISPSVTVNPTTTTVYTVGGIIGSCTDSIATTVTVSPTPTLSLPANSYTVCVGNSVGLSVSGATTYTWTTGTALSCTACANPISTPTANITYTVQGTTGSCVSAASTVTVSINVNPLPTVTLTPSSTALCSSNSSTITASGASTYTWSPSGSLSSATGSTVTATPNSTTDYTVTGTDVNGCTNTSVVNIGVSPTPTINISPVPPAACAGQSVILNGGTATTYTWSANAGSVNTATVSVTPSVNTTYTLTGTTGSCTASAVATVTVNPLPVIGASTVTPAACGQSTGCIDTVLVGGGNPAYQYSWDHGATWSNNVKNCSIPFGTYTVGVKDANGCIDSTTISVSNLNGPTTPAVSAISNTVCLGDKDSLSVSSPLPNIVYTWTDATGTHTGTTYTIGNLSPAGNYGINITATDTNGCSAVSSTSIVVNSLPPTTVTGNTHFCNGSSTVLNASPGGLGYSYQWSQGGVAIPTATSSSYTANAAGTYNVLITDSATGCKSSAAGNYTVTVDSVPLIDTSNMVITSSNCTSSTGAITSVTVSPAGGTTYSWTDASGNVVGTSLNLGSVPAGNYCLHATTTNNCKDSLCALTVNNAGAPNSPVLTTANNTYCQGDPQNPIVVTGTVTLAWYSDAALTTQIATGTTYSPSVATTTTVYVTATSSGCTSAALPIVITINPTPTSPLVAVPSYMYCSSQTIGAITAAGSPTILWSSSPTMNPVINTGTSYTPTGLATGTTIFYLQDSSAVGCKSVGTTTVSVTVNATPSDPTLSVGPATYCQGQTISPITATGTGTILWYDNAGLTPVINTGSTYTPPGTVGTFTYYVVDSSAAGCKSTGSANVTITVNPTPANPTVATPSYTYCQGQAIGQITVTGNPVILWSSSSSMSPVINTGATYTPAGAIGTTTYYLQDSSALGCKSAGIDSVVVTVYPGPSVNGGSADTAKCGLLNGGIHGINVNGGTFPYTYQWSDSSSVLTNDTSLILSGVTSGSYSILVTDVNGCTASGASTIFSIPAIAPVTATITPHSSQGVAPLGVTFTSNTTGATLYGWDFGNGTTSNSQNPAGVTYTAPGTYTVVLMATNGTCSARDTAIVIVDSPVSIIIPNIYSPNGDGINDDWFITCVGIQYLHCDIFNRWGTLVYQLLAPNDVWSGIMNNGNHATEGTYYYILEATGYDGKSYKSHGPLTLVK
jgi:gliding motility-associated-like protein